MPRAYSVPFTAVAITAAQDVWEITPADDKPITVLGLVLGQYTDVGDAASENLSVKISRGWGTSGSGGSTPTPTPLDGIDTGAGFTTEMNNTTLASAGTEVVLFSDVWNTQAGYQMWFPEGVQPRCSQAQTMLTVRITAPADSITANGTLFLLEG